MPYLGSWKIDDLLTFCANTHTASTGAETDADSVPSYRVYEDETGTPILTGSMALLDAANTTGFYSEQITLSAANGFEKGKSYTVRVTGIVAGITASVVHSFQIEAEVNALRIADTHLNRDMSAVSDSVARSPLNALRLLRNKHSIAAGTLTVTKEDDTASAWTAAITTTPGANPITAVDPA